MIEYNKFEYEELPKEAVVNAVLITDEGSEVNQIIHEVVSEHLNSIIKEQTEENVDKSLEEVNIRAEPEYIDIEAIKQESFDRGYNQSKNEYEQQLAELKKDIDLSELLQKKLLEIIPQEEIDSNIAKILAESIANIAKKLHLILPVNFEEIVKQGLFNKLKNFYKKGEITLTVHPERNEFCKEILKLEEIPARIKDNFRIISDDKINKDDCKVEWADTRIEYNQKQLSDEIEKIIEQLKSAT